MSESYTSDMAVSILHPRAFLPVLTGMDLGVPDSPEVSAHSQWSDLNIAHRVTDDVQRKEELAYAIRAAMARRGLSAPDVAKLIGRSPVTVGRWVRGETAPSALDVGPLAAALGVRSDYLIEPPPIPDYPIERYLVEVAMQAGVQQGLQRASARAKTEGREGQ
jgi:transcriptional regulator with XRE-family HTH domain